MLKLQHDKQTYINFCALIPVLVYPLLNFIFSFFIETSTLAFNVIYFILAILYLLPMFVLWLINSKTKKQTITSLKYSPELILLMLFLFWLTLSSFFAQNTTIAFLGINDEGAMFEEGLVQFFAYACMFYFAYNIKEEKIGILLLKVFSIISIIIGILVFIDPVGSIFPAFEHTYPYSAMFVNSNHYGYFLCMAILVNVGLFLFENELWQKIIFALGSTLLIVQLLFNSSFGPAIAVCVTFLALPFSYRIFKQKWRIETFIPIIIFLFSAIFINDGLFYSDLGLTSKQIIGITQNAQDSASYGTGRIKLWSHALHLIIQNPLFGTGLGNFTLNNSTTRPHNEYLQYAVNGGIICGLLYIAAILTIYIKALKNRKSTTNFSFILGGAIFCYLISAFFGNTMPHVLPFFAILLGMFIRSIKKVA